MIVDVSTGGGFVPHTELAEALGIYLMQKSYGIGGIDFYGKISPEENGAEMFSYKGRVYKTYPLEQSVPPSMRSQVVGINFHYWTSDNNFKD